MAEIEIFCFWITTPGTRSAIVTQNHGYSYCVHVYSIHMHTVRNCLSKVNAMYLHVKLFMVGYTDVYISAHRTSTWPDM